MGDSDHEQEWKPSAHYKYLLRAHKTIDHFVADGAVIFVGDSITEGLNTREVAANSVNYGISNDTTTGVLQRLKSYRSIERAMLVVLAIGVNDLVNRSVEDTARDYTLIVDSIPADTPVLLSALLPVDEKRGWKGLNQKVDEMNRHIASLANQRTSLFYMDTSAQFKDEGGNLKQFLHTDGVHLNANGYQIWITALKAVISEMQVTK